MQMEFECSQSENTIIQQERKIRTSLSFGKYKIVCELENINKILPVDTEKNYTWKEMEERMVLFLKTMYFKVNCRLID